MGKDKEAVNPIRVAQKLVARLKDKDVRGIQIDLLDEMEEAIEYLSKIKTKKASEVIIVMALLNPMKDVITHISNFELGVEECQQFHDLLKGAVKDFETYAPDMSASSSDEVEKVFAKSVKGAKRDRKLLRTSRDRRNQVGDIVVDRYIICNATPQFNESDMIDVGIKFMRRSNGYVIIPGQKVLILGKTRGKGEQDLHTAGVEAIKELNLENRYVSAPNVSIIEGMAYVWLIPKKDYIRMFANRELTLWCAFDNDVK